MKIRKKIVYFVLVMSIILLTANALSQNDNAYDPSNPDAFDFNKGSEADKIKYLKNVYGIEDLPSGLGGISISGGVLTITGTYFKLGGISFTGGTVRLDKNKNILSAESTAADGFTHKGSGIVGTFSLKDNSLTIEKGELFLGSETSSDLKISAAKGTVVGVSEGKGYTGTVSAVKGQPFQIKSGDQQVSVSGLVSLVDGKIQEGQGVEAITAVKGLFTGMPPDLEISLLKGDVKGNQISSIRYCLSSDCFNSKEASTVEITSKDKYLIKGEKVKYRENGKLKRLFSSNNGVELDKSLRRWTLNPGTKMTEVKVSGASSIFSVAKKTVYLPNNKRTDCDSVAGSCIAIDDFNSVRVKAKDDNQIKLNNLQVIPALIVDKIDDGSTVEYVEHNLRGAKKGKDKIKLLFSKNPISVYPPSNIKNIDTRILHEYAGRNGNVKALELDTAGKSIKVDGKTVGHIDEWIAKNYYKTSFGDIITKKQKEEYEKIILEKISLAAYHALNKAQKDTLLLLIHNNPEEAKDKIIYIKTNLVKATSNLPENVDPSELTRKILNMLGGPSSLAPSGDQRFFLLGGEASELAAIHERLASVTENHILYSQLLEMYEEGKLSNGAAVMFTSRFLDDIKTRPPGFFSQREYNPEEAQRFLNFLAKVPPDRNKAESMIRDMGNLNEFISQYYRGDRGSAFFDAVDNLLETEKINIVESEFDLPASLKGKVTDFMNTWNNLDAREVLLEPKLADSLSIWEHEPELVKAVNTWNPKKGELFDIPDRYDEGTKERIKIIELVGKAANNQKLSEDARASLTGTFESSSFNLGKLVNHLGHINEPAERQSLVDSLPASVKLEILNTKLYALGEEDGLYTSSEGMIFKSLLKDIGGGENFITFMESQGGRYKIDVEGSKGNDILVILAASGQLKDIVPKDAAKRKQVFSGIVTSLIKEHPTLAGANMRQILSDQKYNKEFSEVILSEYGKIKEKADQDKTEKSRRNYLQFLIRENKDKFDQKDARVADILKNPSPAVKKTEEALTIPTKKWIGGEKKDGKPIIKKLVGWINTEDTNENAAYNAYETAIPGYRLVKRTANGYILEKEGVVLVEEGGKTVQKKVIFQKFVTKDKAEFSKESKTGNYATMSVRGHSYGANAIVSNLKAADLTVFGSCGGANSIAPLKTERPLGAYIGTTKIGVTDTNNKIERYSDEALAVCADYRCLWRYIKDKSGAGIESDKGYVGPADNILASLEEK